MPYLRRTSALVVALLLALPAGQAAGDSNGAESRADTPGCVTKSEFRQVKQGWRKARVHRVFDTAGKLSSSLPGGYTRLYRRCSGSTECRAKVDYMLVSGGASLVASKRWRVCSK